MRTILRTVLVLTICLLASTAIRVKGADFSTVVGTVAKIEKDTLTIYTSDKPSKNVELKVTGTSRLHLLSPQVRSGKTVITQRTAETSDLAPGQSIAAIYTLADKEPVLLTAVIKTVEEQGKK
jgi:hypothetical protein